MEGRLYRYRYNPILEDIVDDLDAWRLIVTRDQIKAAIREVYENPEEQAGPKGLMGHRLVEEPWTVVATDVMDPYPRCRKGNEYLVVYKDLFTKWIEVAPLRAANALAIKTTFEGPEVLHSDRRTEYANNLLDELAKEYGIYCSFSPVYLAQANPVERTNRVLKTMLVSFVEQDHRDWDLFLKDFMFAYNTSVHSTMGGTPAFLNMGRNPRPVTQLNVALGIQNGENRPSKRLDYQ